MLLGRSVDLPGRLLALAPLPFLAALLSDPFDHRPDSTPASAWAAIGLPVIGVLGGSALRNEGSRRSRAAAGPVYLLRPAATTAGPAFQLRPAATATGPAFHLRPAATTTGPAFHLRPAATTADLGGREFAPVTPQRLWTGVLYGTLLITLAMAVSTHPSQLPQRPPDDAFSRVPARFSPLRFGHVDTMLTFT